MTTPLSCSAALLSYAISFLTVSLPSLWLLPPTALGKDVQTRRITAPKEAEIHPWGDWNAMRIIREVSRMMWSFMRTWELGSVDCTCVRINVPVWSKFRRSMQSEVNFSNFCLRDCHLGSWCCIIWCIISYNIKEEDKPFYLKPVTMPSVVEWIPITWETFSTSHFNMPSLLSGTNCIKTVVKLQAPALQ